MDAPRCVDVLGVRVSAVSIPKAVQTVDSWILSGKRHYVCVTGIHGVMESQLDPSLLEIHNHAGLTVPDGRPLVWAGHWVGLWETGHVRGADFMLAVLGQAARKGWRCFFYGGAEGVPEDLAEKMQARFPGLQVVGCYSPPFRALTEQEDAEVVDLINAAEPDIVWVGLSTPKQERWMASHRSELDAPVLIGVGAAFDMHTDRLRQAPVLMQRTGTEWLYRLLSEPRRLWRRYLLGHPRAVGALLQRPPTKAPSREPELVTPAPRASTDRLAVAPAQAAVATLERTVTDTDTSALG